jgi:dTDP-N-acetylfucosamine:lipid II N-acetylfucosaminyltransferase
MKPAGALRVVHLARDEKFMPLMQSLFEEALPQQNRYVIARKRRAKQRFVQDAPNVVFRSEWRYRTRWIAADVADADVLVLHSMSTIFAKAMRHVRPDCLVVWIGWGYDYYPLLAGALGGLYLEHTTALQPGAGDDASEAAGGGGRGGFLARLRERLSGRRPDKQPALVAAAPRIDVCCVIPTELSLLRAALPALRAQAHEIPLFTAEDVFARGPDAMDGPDMLIGNSATASNNHLDLMALLRARTGDTMKLVVPLSYGNGEYRERIRQDGQAWFGTRFEALTGWMAIDAYNQRISGCGYVVMNHRRQQAVGNIGAALYKGATVYLRPENPLFDFYRGLGLHLRSVEDLSGDTTTPLRPLTAPQRAHNRAVINAYYGRKKVVQAISALAGMRRR